MSPSYRFFGIAAVGMLVVLAGCESDDSGGVSGTYGTDQDAIFSLIEEDQDMFGLSLMDDEADYGVGGGSGPQIMEAIDPVAFWRRGVRTLQSIDVEVFGDSAVATVTHTFDGQFMIAVEDTSNPLIDYLVYGKDMYNTITRKVFFARIGLESRYRNWRMTHVTMAEIVSRDPNPNTVVISHLQVVKVDGLSGEETTVLDTQDPLETLISRDSLVTFARGDSAKIFVTLSSPDSAVGLLHYRLRRLWQHRRRPLNDNGIYPDEVAGDGIYSGVWDIGLLPGVYHSCVDMIDHYTVFDDTAPYDATVWGIPYRVTL
jgi:hypothetical protein